MTPSALACTVVTVTGRRGDQAFSALVAAHGRPAGLLADKVSTDPSIFKRRGDTTMRLFRPVEIRTLTRVAPGVTVEDMLVSPAGWAWSDSFKTMQNRMVATTENLPALSAPWLAAVRAAKGKV